MPTNSMHGLDELSNSRFPSITKPPNEHIPETTRDISTTIMLNDFQYIDWYTEMITNFLPFCGQPSKSSKKGEVNIN